MSITRLTTVVFLTIVLLCTPASTQEANGVLPMRVHCRDWQLADFVNKGFFPWYQVADKNDAGVMIVFTNGTDVEIMFVNRARMKCVAYFKGLNLLLGKTNPTGYSV